MDTKEERAKRIGNKLRELRGIRTRVGVAKELGISNNALGFYETGKRIPPDDVKIKIASYYNCSVEEIFFAK